MEHVLGVLDAVEMIAEKEGVSERDQELLKIAALYHDAGFIVDSKNHEKYSCNFAQEFLPTFGYEQDEIATICEIIMATKVPQSPNNHLQQIICDADLDYLGTEDFYTINNKIFMEMKASGTIKNEDEWNQLQVSFLSAHNYFTKTSIQLRKQVKEKHLEEVKKLIKRK
ncbi:MAG: HD domain-containing protein [Bacteroidetes bacterium]|nr:HD domain-containing protein [Bacteroidota bacterium]